MNSAASRVMVLEPVAAFDPVVLPFEGDARLVERGEPEFEIATRWV